MSDCVDNDGDEQAHRREKRHADQRMDDVLLPAARTERDEIPNKCHDFTNDG